MELSLAELKDFAEKFVAALPSASGTRAHVVGLKGDLGAGKTTFTQMVANELKAQGPVTSPTYVFAKSYEIHRPPYERLIHIDAYRLLPEDPDTIGWRAYLKDPANLILVEWPENLNGFPPDASTIAFAVTGENTRSVYHHANDR